MIDTWMLAAMLAAATGEPYGPWRAVRWARRHGLTPSPRRGPHGGFRWERHAVRAAILDIELHGCHSGVHSLATNVQDEP